MVIAKNTDGYEVHITAGKHTLLSDEPVVSGGTDTGPTPYDLLLAALGSCKAITMRMYANRKKIPLEAMTIKLHIEKIYAEDCENCETTEGKIDNIDIEINFVGNLSEEDRKRLLEISEKCPVHKTLMSEVVINSKMN